MILINEVSQPHKAPNLSMHAHAVPQFTPLALQGSAVRLGYKSHELYTTIIYG